MNVWIVLKDYQRDDSTIVGVYATPELAKAGMALETKDAIDDGQVVEGVNDDDGDKDWDVSIAVEGPHTVEGA